MERLKFYHIDDDYIKYLYQDDYIKYLYQFDMKVPFNKNNSRPKKIRKFRKWSNRM